MTELESRPTSDDPNNRYSPTNLGTWSSISDVDSFFSRFNHDNNYSDGDTKLGLGDYVTIQDGTYNAVWVIAGFDMENGRVPANGTVYDNGYGICMIPKTYIGSETVWHTEATYPRGYINSSIHKSTLFSISFRLKYVVGDHLVYRNVLLSNDITTSSSNSIGLRSRGYGWTEAYATLMSGCQLTGAFGSYASAFDDGEACYKLPLFDYESFNNGTWYWLRGIYGKDSSIGSGLRAFTVTNGAITYSLSSVEYAYSSYYARPMIYLR